MTLPAKGTIGRAICDAIAAAPEAINVWHMMETIAAVCPTSAALDSAKKARTHIDWYRTRYFKQIRTAYQ